METVNARQKGILSDRYFGGIPADSRAAGHSAFLKESDITEELTRFGGHLAACAETLAGPGQTGRKLDFLLQEMHRELNTAAAKANTGALAQLAIRGKLELEKVREQVQNLE